MNADEKSGKDARFRAPSPPRPRHTGPRSSPLFSHTNLRAHFLPNGIHNPGELREYQLAFLPTRWDMPCRINLFRIVRASSGENGSLPSLPWAWPAFWTKGPKSLRTLATQALSFSPD